MPSHDYVTSVPSRKFNIVLHSQVTKITKVDLSKDAPTSPDNKSPEVHDPVVMRHRRLPVVPGKALPAIVETGPKGDDGKKVRRSAEIKDGHTLLSLLEDEQDPTIFERTGSSRRRRRKPAILENLVIDRERAASPNRFSSGTNSPVDPVTRGRRSYSCIDGSEVDRVLGIDRRASFRSPRSPLVLSDVSTQPPTSETDETNSGAGSDAEAAQRQRESRREERKRRSRLNMEELLSAFDANTPTETTSLTMPDKMSDRRKRWAERRTVSQIDPSAVRSVLDQHDATQLNSASATPQVNEIDQTIRDVEETGREIQMMRLDSTGSRRHVSTRLTRRWRSELDKPKVEEAVRNAQNTVDNTPVPPVRRSRSRSSSINDGTPSLHNRLDATPETPTQKAMLNHSTGSWRSNSIGDDDEPTSPTFRKSTKDYVPVSVRMGLAPRRRPQSTYDNIPEDGPSPPTENGSPRDSRRHGIVVDDSVDIDESSRSSLARSATLPRHWKSISCWANPIVEDGKSDTAYRRRHLQQRPVKLNALEIDGGVIIAAPVHRGDYQQQELDSNIQAFQSRTLHSGRNLHMKSRFQHMAQVYRDLDNEDVEKPVEVDTPASVVPTTELGDNSCKSDDTDSVASARDEGFESEYVCNSQRTSMSSTLDGELPSMSGNVDGDGSATINSTNDDLTSTPTETRKTYGDLMSTPTETRKHLSGSQADSFAHSFESIINTTELTLTGTINVDEPGDNYNQSNNDFDTDKTMTASAPEEGDSTTDEIWMTEEYTIEHKVMVPPPEPEQLPPAPPHRTTSRAESVKAAATPTRSALHRKTDLTKPLRKSPATTKTPTPLRMTTRNETAKAASSPSKSSKVAAAVTARLSRPKRPSVLSRHPSTSSLTSDGSVGSSVPTKPTRHPRPTRPSSTVMSPPSRATTRSPLTPDVMTTRTSHPAFVRGAGGRATMPASMLRAQKRLAAEARLTKEEAPVPPRRSSSIRRSKQLNLGMSPPLHRPLTAASPGDTESATSSGDERSTPGGKPRRLQRSSASFASHDLSKEGKVSRLFTRLATTNKPKPKASPVSDGFPRKTELRQRTPTANGNVSATDENRNEKTTGDNKSFLKNLIDKSSYRKSVLNRSTCGDMSPAGERKANVNISRTATLRSSKC